MTTMIARHTYFNLFGPMEFFIKSDTFKSGWFIIYNEGSQVIISNDNEFLSPHVVLS